MPWTYQVRSNPIPSHVLKSKTIEKTRSGYKLLGKSGLSFFPGSLLFLSRKVGKFPEKSKKSDGKKSR